MNEREVKEICRQYGFDRQAFEYFLEDYFVHPLAELPPWPDEPVDLETGQIARQVGLPAYVVRMAQEEGAICTPVTAGDLDSLKVVKLLFGKAWFVRAQLTKSNLMERQLLIQRPELLHWERWAYNRFLAQKVERVAAEDRVATQDQRLYLSSMLRTIDQVFGVPTCKMTKDRLIQVRKMATNDFYAARRRGIDPAEMSKKRGVELEEG